MEPKAPKRGAKQRRDEARRERLRNAREGDSPTPTSNAPTAHTHAGGFSLDPPPMTQPSAQAQGNQLPSSANWASAPNVGQPTAPNPNANGTAPGQQTPEKIPKKAPEKTPEQTQSPEPPPSITRSSGLRKTQTTMNEGSPSKPTAAPGFNKPRQGATGRPQGQAPRGEPTGPAADRPFVKAKRNFRGRYVPESPVGPAQASEATTGEPPASGASFSGTTGGAVPGEVPAASGTTANGTTYIGTKTGYQGRNNTSTDWDKDWTIDEPTHTSVGYTKDRLDMGDVFSMPYVVTNSNPDLNFVAERRLGRTCEGYVYSKRRMFVVLWKHETVLVCLPLGTRSGRGITTIPQAIRYEHACLEDLGVPRPNGFFNASSYKTIQFNKTNYGSGPLSDQTIIDLAQVVTTNWDHDMRYVGRVTKAGHRRLLKYHHKLNWDAQCFGFMNRQWSYRDGPDGSP